MCLFSSFSFVISFYTLCHSALCVWQTFTIPKASVEIFEKTFCPQSMCSYPLHIYRALYTRILCEKTHIKQAFKLYRVHAMKIYFFGINFSFCVHTIFLWQYIKTQMVDGFRSSWNYVRQHKKTFIIIK